MLAEMAPRGFWRFTRALVSSAPALRLLPAGVRSAGRTSGMLSSQPCTAVHREEVLSEQSRAVRNVGGGVFITTVA